MTSGRHTRTSEPKPVAAHLRLGHDPDRTSEMPIVDAMNDQIERLEAGRRAILAMQPMIEDGEPWALSLKFGEEPGADWGPKEVLAHVAEFLPYWLGEIERLLDGDLEPVPFGRIASDSERIERVGRDRLLSVSELFERVNAAVRTTAARLGSLDPEDASKLGLHERRGEMTVATISEQFIVGHLEEHIAQLKEILGTVDSDRAVLAD